jgi:hypothetical protein
MNEALKQLIALETVSAQAADTFTYHHAFFQDQNSVADIKLVVHAFKGKLFGLRAYTLKVEWNPGDEFTDHPVISKISHYLDEAQACVDYDAAVIDYATKAAF